MTFHNIQNRKTFYNNNDPYCVYDKVAHFVVMWVRVGHQISRTPAEKEIQYLARCFSNTNLLKTNKRSLWLMLRFITSGCWQPSNCFLSNKQTNKQSDAAVTVSAASSSPSSPAQLWLEEAAQRPESTPPGARGQSCLLNFTERRFL